jgi:hypothetical protein
MGCFTSTLQVVPRPHTSANSLPVRAAGDAPGTRLERRADTPESDGATVRMKEVGDTCSRAVTVKEVKVSGLRACCWEVARR